MNDTLPGPTPDITPSADIVATDTSVLDHCPPVVGEILDSSPSHISVGPV